MRSSSPLLRPFTKTWLLWLVAVAAMTGPADAQDKYCLSDDSNPYLYYATKTAYHFVQDRRDGQENVPKCQPVQLWLLARHGTRYMGEKKLKKYYKLEDIRNVIVKAYEEFRRGELCYEDLTALKMWRPMDVKLEMANMLTDQGYQDMDLMARRFKTAFHTLLDAPYSPDRFIFKFAESSRTHDSAKAFADGLFGRGSVQIPDSFQDDDLLMPNRNCSAMDRIKEDHKNMEEAKKFAESSLMANMAKTVSKRFGYEIPQQMDLIFDMYEACRFVKSWNISNVSPWCSGFHKEDLQMLEYYQDLKSYYQSGYGQELTKKIGCPLLKDMLVNFNKITSKNLNDTRDSARGVFYFVHSVMIRALLTTLGIGRDPEPPRHDNYLNMAQRKWRVSFLSPFAANLAAVMYKCNGTGEENKVMFFLNERMVDYEGCNVGLCEWSFIYKKFKQIIESESCSYEFCNRGKGSGQSVARIQLSLISILFLVVTIFR